MNKYLVICFQTAVFTIICCVMSQYLPQHAPTLVDHPWYHSQKDMPQGVAKEEGNPHPENTEPPPKRDCVCSKIYDPVCASNNESYFNLCFLECKVPKSENVSVVHQGNCIPF